MEKSTNDHRDPSDGLHETDLNLIREKLGKREMIHLISQNKEDIKKLISTLIDENYELQLTIGTVGDDMVHNRITVRMLCTDKH